VDSRWSRPPTFKTIDTWRWQSCRPYAPTAFTSKVVWFDWFHSVTSFRHTYSSQAWVHVTSGRSAQCRVRVDQRASEIATVKVPVFLRTFSCSNDTSVARIRVWCCHVTPGILDNLRCLPNVATACGWAEVDTSPLTCGGCYHVTVGFVRLALKDAFKHHAVSTQGHSATGRVRSVKNSSDSIGNWTRDLPACSAQPQPTAPPHALIPDEWQYKWKEHVCLVIQNGKAVIMTNSLIQAIQQFALFATEPCPLIPLQLGKKDVMLIYRRMVVP